jgi:polyhydroxyalkanoate synthase
MTQFVSGPVRFALGGSGHIAGVINSPSKGRGYWINDNPGESADQWLEEAEYHDGSWWTDWLEWLKPRSGELVAPPPMGSEAFPPLTPAPGTYVLEK